MSIRFVDSVFKDTAIKNHIDLLVSLALADFSDNDGIAWPSVPTLAKKTRLSERTVRYSLERLEALKKLTKIQGPGGRGKTACYKIEKVAHPATFHYPERWHPVQERWHPVQEKVASHATTYIEGSVFDPSLTPEISKKGILFSQRAEEIYEKFPKKVAKCVAIKAIEKQLRNFKDDTILQATIAFAKVWENATADELQYCPRPEKWFSEERFLDSPSTWRNRQGKTNRVLRPEPGAAF
jgi:hypothetical protein